MGVFQVPGGRAYQEGLLFNFVLVGKDKLAMSEHNERGKENKGFV